MVKIKARFDRSGVLFHFWFNPRVAKMPLGAQRLHPSGFGRAFVEMTILRIETILAFPPTMAVPP